MPPSRSKEGEVSDPVAGRFGHSLVRVVRIEAGSVRPFAEVEAEIREELALAEAPTAWGTSMTRSRISAPRRVRSRI